MQAEVRVMTRVDYSRLEERLGHTFAQPSLLERALTHSSAVPELRDLLRDRSRDPFAAALLPANLNLQPVRDNEKPVYPNGAGRRTVTEASS